jgi:hypothetical protein
VWRIQNLEKGEVTLDFSSAESGSFRTSALTADDTAIVNATTLVEMEDDGCVQVIVCTECGTVHCEPGGWVQPRRFGDALLWLPCFQRLVDDNAEYRPPDFFKERGLPFFDAARAQRLGDLLPLFRLDVTPSVTLRDVALLTQWLAPWHVLGKPGDPVRVKRDLVIAASNGELEAIVHQLESILQDALSDMAPVRPTSATPGPEFYLDGVKKTPTWNPLVIDDALSLRLSVDGVTAAARDPG